MGLYFTAVVGVRIGYRDSMLDDDAMYKTLTNLARETASKLQAAEIPNAHCKYFSAWECGETVFQLGSWLPGIRSASSGAYMTDNLPELTHEHKKAIEQIAKELIADLQKHGVTADFDYETGLSITCSS